MVMLSGVFRFRVFGSCEADYLMSRAQLLTDGDFCTMMPAEKIRRRGVVSSASLRMLTLVCSFVALVVGSSSASARDKSEDSDTDTGIAPPPVPLEATVATTSVAVGGVGVDESVRFGVSLPELHKRTAQAVSEVLWSHSSGGMDAVTSLGFSVNDAGSEILVTVLPGRVVADENLRVDVRHDQVTRSAKLLRIDEPTGVALLRIGSESGDGQGDDSAGKPAADAGRRRLTLVRNDKPRSAAVVFGFDQIDADGGPERCVPGRIAGRDSRYQGETLPTSLWRIHMNLSATMAGAPLLNEAGDVVAIMSARKLSAPDEHHAVPIPVLSRLLRDLAADQPTGVAWIGATFHIDSSTPQIVSVREDSPAQRAGLRPQDVVVSIGGDEVRTLDQLADAFYYLSAGQATQVEVLRGLEKLSFRLVPTLFENPDLDGDGVDDRSGNRSLPRTAVDEGDTPSAAVRSRKQR